MVLHTIKRTEKLFLLQMSNPVAQIGNKVGDAVNRIDDDKSREIVLALIKHRLRISHTSYYRKIGGEGFDPEQLATIEEILNEYSPETVTFQ